VNSQAVVLSAFSPPGSASRSWRSIGSVPSALVRVPPAGSSTDVAAPRAVSCAIPQWGPGSASARWRSASTMRRPAPARGGRRRRRAAISASPPGSVGAPPGCRDAPIAPLRPPLQACLRRRSRARAPAA
jgi:hypothetical protein